MNRRSAPTDAEHARLIEMAAFAAFGLLDEEDDKEFQRLLHAAPQEVREAAHRAMKEIVDADEVGDASVEPPPSLSPRVLTVLEESIARYHRSGSSESEKLRRALAKLVSDQIAELFRRAIAPKVEELPKDYASRREALTALNDATRVAIAKALEAPLNAHAATLPQDTYEDKKTLAKWINAELRQFGLALKCDRTDRPCILVGNPGNRPDVGRFMLQYMDERGKLHHPLTSVTLPKLELMTDDLARATYPNKGREL